MKEERQADSETNRKNVILYGSYCFVSVPHVVTYPTVSLAEEGPRAKMSCYCINCF